MFRLPNCLFTTFSYYALAYNFNCFCFFGHSMYLFIYSFIYYLAISTCIPLLTHLSFLFWPCTSYPFLLCKCFLSSLKASPKDLLEVTSLMLWHHNVLIHLLQLNLVFISRIVQILCSVEIKEIP